MSEYLQGAIGCTLFVLRCTTASQPMSQTGLQLPRRFVPVAAAVPST